MKHLHLFGGNGYIGRSLQLHFQDYPYVVITTDLEERLRGVKAEDRYMLHLACPRKTLPTVYEAPKLLNASYDFGIRFNAALQIGEIHRKHHNIPNNNVLYFSSQSIWDSPLSLYGHYKVCGESFAWEHGYKILRPGTVFGFKTGGPIRGDTAINRVMLRLLNRDNVFVTRAARCWTSLEELCKVVENFIYGADSRPAWARRVRLNELFPGVKVRDETGCSLKHTILYADHNRSVYLRSMIRLYMEKLKLIDPEVV